MSKEQDLALVARLMRRVRTQFLWCGAVAAAASLVLLLIWPGLLTHARALFGGDAYASPPFWIVVGTILLTNAAIWWMAQPSLRVETSPIYLALRDGPQSVVWDEAENRLHVQKGILAWCLA